MAHKHANVADGIHQKVGIDDRKWFIVFDSPSSSDGSGCVTKENRWIEPLGQRRQLGAQREVLSAGWRTRGVISLNGSNKRLHHSSTLGQ
jgi:hypothetical protein